MLPEPTLNSYLMLGAVLVSVGTVGVFLRRNLIAVLLSIAVMFVGVSLTLVAAGRHLGRFEGQHLALLVMVVAGCHLAVGFGVAIVLARQRGSSNPDEVTELK